MNVVFLVLGVLLVALAIHFIAWRVRVPRRATKTLMAIAAGGLLVVLCIGWRWTPAFGWEEVLYASSLYGAIAVCYILTYTAIEGDSPTLSLVHYIAASGESGRALSEIETFFEVRPFVQS